MTDKITWSNPIPHDGSIDCPADARNVPCTLFYSDGAVIGQSGSMMGRDFTSWKIAKYYRISATRLTL